MHFVPNFGPKGMLLVLGGVTTDGTFGFPSFDTIPVFDLDSKQWYNQSTSGEAPAGRGEHCVAVKASVNQSYEIFAYRGHNFSWGSGSIPFETVHILPAFHWLHVDYPPLIPRAGGTCNAVAGSQILTVGGLDASQGYLEPALSTKDPFAQGLGIFDLDNLSWSQRYSASSPPYVQSDVVKQVYSQRKR